jgi:hypothetical protein
MLKQVSKAVHVVIAVVVVIVIACTRVQAQALTVTSAQENTVTNQLIIQGGTFSAGLLVFLGPTFTELSVVSVTPSQVLATLSGFPAGSYLLVLYQPSTKQLATFDVTLGAVGPAGPGNSVATVSNTGTCTLPTSGSCFSTVAVSCPTGSVPVGCFALPSYYCSDGSIGIAGTSLSAPNTCTAIGYNNSPQGACGRRVVTYTVQAQCLNVP